MNAVSRVRRAASIPCRTIADFFRIERGLATGHNGCFILSAEELAERRLPKQCFRPILPSPRYVDADEVAADAKGNSVLIDRRNLATHFRSERQAEWAAPGKMAHRPRGWPLIECAGSRHALGGAGSRCWRYLSPAGCGATNWFVSRLQLRERFRSPIG